MKLLVGSLVAGRVQLLELAGAASIVIGFTSWLGGAAGWIAAGVALLGKSLEWDMRGGGKA